MEVLLNAKGLEMRIVSVRSTLGPLLHRSPREFCERMKSDDVSIEEEESIDNDRQEIFQKIHRSSSQQLCECIIYRDFIITTRGFSIDWHDGHK